MSKPGVMFYFEIRPCIKRLTLEEKGQLFEAILDYGEYGAIPDVDGAVGVAWDFIQQRLDRDTGRYTERVDQTKYAVASREAKKKKIQLPPFEKWRLLSDEDRERLISDDIGRYPTSISTAISTPTAIPTSTPIPTDKESEADKPPSRHRFSPPSAEDIREYCRVNEYKVDPDRFVDFYSSNGWMIGNNPMRDWKSAVKNWHNRTKKESIKPRDTDLDDIM